MVERLSRGKIKRDRDLHKLAEKLRAAGKHKCAECGLTFSRKSKPPFADCDAECLSVRVIQYAEKMDADIGDSC